MSSSLYNGWNAAHCYSPYQVGPLYLQVTSPTNSSFSGYIKACFTGVPGTAGLCFVEDCLPTNDGGHGSPNYFYYNTTTSGDLTSGEISSSYPAPYVPIPGTGPFVMSLSAATAGSNIATLNVAGGSTYRLIVGFDQAHMMYRVGGDESQYTQGQPSTGASPPNLEIAYYDWLVCWMYVQRLYSPFLVWLEGHERVPTNPTCVGVHVSMVEVQ
ncbi:hypothetical protein GGR57DRAFT_482326 [Xylariaceae sp. FL1272]|nr:hypothetical protein GGR57DRAFT_482326 [Xylariaceae sp. FL1272]